MTERHRLIDSLVNDLRPARPLAAPAWRAARWLAAAFVIVTAGLLLVQAFRPGWFADLANGRFFLETGAALAMAVAATAAVFRLAVPGLTDGRIEHSAVALFTVAWAASLGAGLLGAPALVPASSGMRPFCELEVLLWGLLGTAVLVPLLKRGWFPRGRIAAFETGLTAAALPAALMQVACMYSPEHALAFHLLPALLVGAAAAIALPRLSRAELKFRAGNSDQ